jgi:hypothetical protein
MKKLKCHCGAIEAEINYLKFRKILRCNCSFVKEKEQLCLWLKMKILKL